MTIHAAKADPAQTFGGVRAPGRYRARRLAWTAVVAFALVTVGCAGGPGLGGHGPHLGSAAGAKKSVAPPVRVTGPGAYLHFLEARRLELSRRYDHALSEYLAALTYAPDSRTLLMGTAHLYLKNGDPEGAIDIAEQALDRYPDDPMLLQFLARLYVRRGKPELAEDTYQRLIDQRPTDVTAHNLLLLSYIQQKRFDEAKVLIRKVRKLAPKSPLPDYYTGRIHLANKRYRKAQRAFATAVRKDPGFEVGYLDQARAYESTGAVDKAIAVYQKVVDEVNPNSPFARDRLIQIHTRRGDLAAVVTQFDNLLAMNPRSHGVLYRKALLLTELKRYDEAILSLARALSIKPADLRTLELLASVYESEMRPDDAESTLSRILELDPDHLRALMRMGYLADAAGDAAERDRRVAEVAMLIVDHPEDIRLYRYVAWGSHQAGDFEAAARYLSEALEVAPENEAVHFSLGANYYELNRFEDMERELNWVLERNPTHPHALNFLGYSYAERGIRLGDAEALVQRALVLQPDDGMILDSLAWVHYQQGNYKKALKMQQQALLRLPDGDAVLLDHLGSIHLKLGQKADAREAWIQALEMDPDAADLRKRFREAGFGDPAAVERIEQARERLMIGPEGNGALGAMPAQAVAVEAEAPVGISPTAP